MKPFEAGRSFIKPRKRKSPPAGSLSEWISYAEGDLELARLAIGNQNVMASQICFHAPQAAEKAIKSILIAKHLDFPLTHDIDELYAIFRKAGLSIPENVRKAGALSPFAVEARYPEFDAKTFESDIPKAVKMADLVLRWAKKTIRKGPKNG